MTQWWESAPVVPAPPTPERWWEHAEIVVPAPREHEKEIQARKASMDRLNPYGFEDDFIERGVMLGAADEIAGVAGGLGGLVRSIYKEGEGFGKGYTVASEAARDRQKEYAKRHPGRSITASLVGGLVPGVGAAKAGLTALRAGQTIPQAMRAGAIDAAAMGAVGGFAQGEGLEGRLWEAGKGATVGGLIGAGLPPAVALGKATVGALGGNALVGSLDPKGYAMTLLARAQHEAGMTPKDLRASMTSAKTDAQGDVWAVADALGYPGQRLLAGVTQSPSMARKEAHDFLKKRQAGQGERISEALEDNMGTARTAKQAREELIDERDDTAKVLYGAAREQAGAVDLEPVLQNLDKRLKLTQAQVTVTPTRKGQKPARQRIDESKLPKGSIAASLARLRNSLTDVGNGVTLKDFGLIYHARQDLADEISRTGIKPPEQGGGYNNKGSILAGFRKEIDAALEQASAPYRVAADRYRADSKLVEAVTLGEKAAIGEGDFARFKDNIKLYNALPDGEKEAFRAGYVSQLLKRVERAPGLRNQSETFSSMKTEAELRAFSAPGRGERLPRSLQRESTMHETRKESFLGSPTVRNLNDQDDVNNQLSVIANLLTGQWRAAGQSAVSWGQSYAKGYRPQVREEVIRMLLQRPGQRGQGEAFKRFQKALTEKEARNLLRERSRSVLLRGAYGGLAAQ